MLDGTVFNSFKEAQTSSTCESEPYRFLLVSRILDVIFTTAYDRAY